MRKAANMGKGSGHPRDRETKGGRGGTTHERKRWSVHPQWTGLRIGQQGEHIPPFTAICLRSATTEWTQTSLISGIMDLLNFF